MSSPTLVIEDSVLQRRLRRPSDLGRLVLSLAVTAAVTLISYVAQSTTSGIDADLAQGAGRLPSALLIVASLVNGLGTIALPLLASADLLARRRSRQLIEAVGALVVTVVVLVVASWAVTRLGSDRLLRAFAGPTPRAKAAAFNAALGGLAGFITVARLMSRSPWAPACAVVTGSVALADILSGGITAAGLGVSVLTGWSVGLVIRYALGTETSRPRGTDIAEHLARSGIRLTLLRASEVTESGRQYLATTDDGRHLELVVLDRDLEGAGLAMSVYRSLRLRDAQGRSGTSMRSKLDRTALLSWAAQAAGIPVPRLLAVSDIGPDAAVLVYQRVPGRPFSALPATLGDAELAGAWHVVHELQQADLVHRTLTPENFLLGDDSQVYLHGLSDGAIAASDVLLRVDVAEALCTLALLTDPLRAIRAGRAVLGDTALARALPALQTFALSSATRRALRQHKDLLGNLRRELTANLPEVETQQVEIERIKPRRVATGVLGTIGAYLLLNQLAQVDLLTLFRTADTRWMAIGLGLSVLTYVAATAVMIGVVPERLSLWKTFQVQWAASFATLVAPPTVGSMAVNGRFLSRQNLRATDAGASIALSQVLAFLSHITLLVVTVIVAGTSRDLAFRPPRTALIVVALLALAAAGAMAVPRVRRRAASYAEETARQAIKRIAALSGMPSRWLAAGVGVLALNASYCLCLVACVRAFSDASTFAAISLVYLTASVIAQAAPTPGGIGAVEAAIAAGLTAAGMDAGVALSGTLLFRAWTFWFPAVPGWLAFNNLQRTGDI